MMPPASRSASHDHETEPAAWQSSSEVLVLSPSPQVPGKPPGQIAFKADSLERHQATQSFDWGGGGGLW